MLPLLALATSLGFGWLSVRWIKTVQANTVWSALAVSVLLDIGHSLDTVYVVTDVWIAPISVLGSAVGTYLGLKTAKTLASAPSLQA